MMSYSSYPPLNSMMYRNQSGVPQFPNGPIHPWYAGYHHSVQNSQMMACNYAMQEQQQQLQHQPWHQPQGQPFNHSVFHNMIPQQQIDNFENQLPSPPTTVTSNLSSPDCLENENNQNNALCMDPLALSPSTKRPPFEWIKKSSLPRRNETGKTRTKDKYRVVYSDHQRIELEKEFYYNKYINIRRKAELSAALGLTDRQVKIWFQNRRAKDRKQAKKREETSVHSPIRMSDCAQSLLQNFST